MPLITDIPEITTHPKNVTTTEGGNLTLSCNATGNPVPKISWTKDGSPISSNSRISLSQDDKQLTITNVNRTDSGEYRCVADNSLGNDTSNAAKLYVQCKWLCNLAIFEIIQSDFSSVNRGLKEYKCSFHRNNYKGCIKIKLVINVMCYGLSCGWRESRARCSSRHSLGNYNYSFELLVILTDEAEITGHPQNVTVIEGISVILSCNATGNPEPTISWTKDGYPISNNSRISLSADDNKKLTITNGNRTDSGEYRCVASNSLGNDTSSVATVNVICKYSMTDSI